MQCRDKRNAKQGESKCSLDLVYSIWKNPWSREKCVFFVLGCSSLKQRHTPPGKPLLLPICVFWLPVVKSICLYCTLTSIRCGMVCLMEQLSIGCVRQPYYETSKKKLIGCVNFLHTNSEWVGERERERVQWVILLGWTVKVMLCLRISLIMSRGEHTLDTHGWCPAREAVRGEGEELGGCEIDRRERERERER